jgi:hypothetical protein
MFQPYALWHFTAIGSTWDNHYKLVLLMQFSNLFIFFFRILVVHPNDVRRDDRNMEVIKNIE